MLILSRQCFYAFDFSAWSSVDFRLTFFKLFYHATSHLIALMMIYDDGDFQNDITGLCIYFLDLRKA